MLYYFLRNILFLFPPEIAHRLSLTGLWFFDKTRLNKLAPKAPISPKKVMDIHFPNPVGLAAGLDKNGKYIDGLAALGFGFLEIGTITPKAQPGNPKPRLFRLPSQEAIINRMGLNNEGLENLIKNLKKMRYKGVLGISIGPNNDTKPENAVEDILLCFEGVYDYAGFISIDISCPNVSNGYSLQEEKYIDDLLSALKSKQKDLTKTKGKYVPIVVKISPDLPEPETKNIAQKFLNHDIDGVIATNTTITRPGVESYPMSKEKGGLSGKPLFKLSLKQVKLLHQTLEDKIPIIAVGGIMKSKDATKMFAAGASLVQVYTGFIYHGPKLIRDICRL